MPHILIVEDESAIADTLVYALQADGHSTDWVTLGSAALEQQRLHPGLAGMHQIASRPLRCISQIMPRIISATTTSVSTPSAEALPISSMRKASW